MCDMLAPANAPPMVALAAFAKWAWVRANVTAISGTDAEVTVTVNQA